ncbi:YlqD family protein [Calidifontibacillus oryziterrae]|uniref:YlqD family protein n=1 Tax=Calidifontibacillus oryziterrae TaxID=1191699 RepID=UPI0002F96997|nr:YlqD family protein [Calidifontibacillus oryziterrae]
MKIIKNITVKQVLTEDSKKSLAYSFKTQMSKLEKEIDQFRFEKKKFEKTKKIQTPMIAAQIEKEISLRTEKCKLLKFQLEQLDILPLGSELKETEVQGIIEINKGDNWDEIVKERVIIVKDGIISELR